MNQEKKLFLLDAYALDFQGILCIHIKSHDQFKGIAYFNGLWIYPGSGRDSSERESHPILQWYLILPVPPSGMKCIPNIKPTGRPPLRILKMQCPILRN